MAKIGIIRCQENSNQCAGYHCFPAIRDKNGYFEKYDTVEVVGFDTCGGCGRNKPNKILARALRLKEKGAEAIHLGNCLVGGCPFKEIYLNAIKEELKLPVVENTHQ